MSSDKKTNVVGYVLKKFPVLSETFILNELLELEAQDVPVHVFSLERPSEPRFHEEFPKLKARVTYVPSVSGAYSLWKHTVRAARSYGNNYTRALTYMLRHGRPSLLWRFSQSCYIANEARRFGICHFHAHFATRPTTVASLASMISGIPYSFTAHAMDIFKTRLSTKILKKKITQAKFVVTVSEYNRARLADIVERGSEKIFKIYNGIDLERFLPGEEQKRTPFTFICVARFVEKKGHRVLIEACEILRKRNLSFECWLVGKGKLRTSIQDLIKEKNLGTRVRLLGPHSHHEVMARYRNSHAYVLPCIIGSDGNRDGLPVSIVEALASGLPVVTTPMTGNPEVVKEYVNGLLVPFNDSVALADVMEKLIKDRNLYQSLQKNTRLSVESRFDLHQTAGELHKLFQRSIT